MTHSLPTRRSSDLWFGFPEASQRKGVGRRTAGRKIVLGIGNAIGADVGDDLREAVRVANELSIKIRANQRDVEDILVGQLDAEQFLRLKLDVPPSGKSAILAIKHTPGEIGRAHV